MVGMSISFCFKEMGNGKVNPDYVSKVIGSTAFSTEAEAQYTITNHYLIDYDWNSKAVELFWEFWHAGKID